MTLYSTFQKSIMPTTSTIAGNISGSMPTASGALYSRFFLREKVQITVPRTEAIVAEATASSRLTSMAFTPLPPDLNSSI